MQIVLDTPGLSLSRKGALFLITDGERSQQVSPPKISSIAVVRQCHICSQAIMLAAEHDIPILLFDHLGRLRGRLWSPYFTSLATLRRQQVYFAHSPAATYWVVSVLTSKLQQCEQVLTYLRRRRQAHRVTLEEAAWRMQEHGRKLDLLLGQPIVAVRSRLLAAEGATMRPYWQAVGQAMPSALQFRKRSRQPATDPFNAALNYAYGMLYGIVEGALFAVGLDPHLGILHVDQYNQPTLAFDLIEMFRPWADRLLVSHALDKELKSSFFTEHQDGLLLSKPGKAFLIPSFNSYLAERVTWEHQQSSRRNHIYRAAGQLAQHIRDFSVPPPYDSSSNEE